MKPTTTQLYEEVAAENQKGIENHKKTATLLEAAAKHHREAARHHSEGNHDKAAQSTITAQGYLSLAIETQQEDIKHHALNDLSSN
ncbi:MAG TPA: hypothetical protein VFW11_09965 [Cyclobacteriaceae bacterium]|nr:hypothetical protein [Cyclobacteriaceae bacterium]